MEIADFKRQIQKYVMTETLHLEMAAQQLARLRQDGHVLMLLILLVFAMRTLYVEMVDLMLQQENSAMTEMSTQETDVVPLALLRQHMNALHLSLHYQFAQRFVEMASLKLQTLKCVMTEIESVEMAALQIAK